VKDARQRPIPPQFDALGQQMLLNLALAGIKVIGSEGNDMTEAALRNAEPINAGYDEWLADWRNRTALPGADAASADRRVVSPNARTRQRTRATSPA
jgi:hypothetical protein